MISYLPCEWQPRKGQAKKSLPALGLRDILRGVPRRMLIRRVLRGMLRGRAEVHAEVGEDLLHWLHWHEECAEE